MLRYSPIALVLVLIAIAIVWEADRPDEDRYATRPLQGDYEDQPRTRPTPPPPMPELPVYDPELDDPHYRQRAANDDNELHDEMARELAGGTANLDVDEIREVLNASTELPGASDPAVTARRMLATLHRRQQQLELVQRLLDQVLPQIESAQQAGNDERAAWLDQTRGRLETRRNAIVESIVEMGELDDDLLSSNEELRSAVQDIRRFQPGEGQ